jgi:hypothetical protein
MLHPVEILPGARRSLRRAVHLDAEVVAAPWSAPRLHRVTDLSPEGMRVAAGTRLPVDEPVLVSFTPPGWWVLGEVSLLARVARHEPREGDRPASMGLEFLRPPAGVRDQLARTLQGRPPPLRVGRRPARRELVWVDVLVTYTEDLGDRVNTFEVSEVMRAEDLDALEVEPLSGLLTGARRPYEWQHAA